MIDQMETDIHKTATLDPLLQDGIKLTVTERNNLKSFLRTLNDDSYVNDHRFAEQ